MILICHIAHICNGQVYTKNGVVFFVEISVSAPGSPANNPALAFRY
jgi:hypothetical protein